MFTQNLHAHGQFDDGACTLEAMLLASKAAGLTSIGFSVHSPLPYGCVWACPAERLDAYRSTVQALRDKYAGEMEVFCGMEWDVLSEDVDLSAFDYAIGSAHHLPVPMKLPEGCPPKLAARFALDYPCVDESADATQTCLDGHFGGDRDAFAQAYFAQIARVAQQPGAQIVGHFDLLTKFDEARGFFTPETPAYRAAALHAMETLARAGKIFEVNTGAIARGYRTTPYPSRALLGALREMGGRVTISADTHHTSSVAGAFELAERLIREAGFREVWRLARVDGRAAFVPETL